jgi:hypothetical protein
MLASDADRASLAGPLKGVNALSCQSSAQLHQFVEEMAAHLAMSVDRPSAYQRCVEEIVSMSSRPPGSNDASLHSAGTVAPHTPRRVETPLPQPHGAPHLGQSRLSEAERHAAGKLRDGVPVSDVVQSLERRGITRRIAEEMTRELRRDLDKLTRAGSRQQRASTPERWRRPAAQRCMHQTRANVGSASAAAILFGRAQAMLGVRRHTSTGVTHGAPGASRRAVRRRHPAGFPRTSTAGRRFGSNPLPVHVGLTAPAVVRRYACIGEISCEL